VIRAGRSLKKLGVEITEILVFRPPIVEDYMLVLDIGTSNGIDNVIIRPKYPK
jgi:hypothetical protein